MNNLDARLVVGIDWATEEHQVCALSPAGTILKERSFAHSGDGLADLVLWLEELSSGELAQVWVAIEVPHGAVVETLLERGCQVFSLNPKQLDRFRDRFSVAGAKDDRRDARVLADSLRTDPHCFRRLRVEDPLVIELREWSRMHDELKQERSRLTNRLREQLRRYYPQCLVLTHDVGESWFLDLWRRVPTPEDARKVPARVVAAILKRHRIRRLVAAEIIEVLRKKPVVVAPGTIAAATAHIRFVADRLEVVNGQLRDCGRQLDTLVEKLAVPADHEPDCEQKREPHDVEILRSLPGVGRIILAALLAEAAEPLRRRDYHTLRVLSGSAPVTIRSGKSCRVVMRQACHPRLREACYHWARVAMQCDPTSRAMYKRLRQRGKTHGRVWVPEILAGFFRKLWPPLTPRQLCFLGSSDAFCRRSR